MIHTLMNLTGAYGISGDEKQVADVLHNEMSGLYDECFGDVLGNQYFIKYGKNRDKKLVFAAHMDEIGLGIIGIPEQYMHTAVDVVDLNDIAATADLVAAFIREY